MLVNQSVNAWFAIVSRTVVESSAGVARSYLDEQNNYISEHVDRDGGRLNQAAPPSGRAVTFSHLLRQPGRRHGFSAAYVIDRDGRILARAETDDAPPFLPPPPPASSRRHRRDRLAQPSSARTCSARSIG